MSSFLSYLIRNAPPSGVANNPYSGKKICWVGDSIVFGVGSTGNEYRHSTLTVNALGALEDNRGVSGRVMQNGVTGDACIELHPPLNVTTIPVYSTEYAALVIALGVNDVGTNNGTMTVTGFRAAYEAALDYAINVRGWPLNRILLLTPYFITGYDQYLGSCGVVTQATQTRLFEYRDEVISIASAYGVAVLDICTEMQGVANLLTSDGVHPNDNGHSFISIKTRAALLALNLN